MQVFVRKEVGSETRVAATPETVKKFIKLGLSVCVEANAGYKSFYSDEAYKNEGAEIVEEPKKMDLLSRANVILGVLKPTKLEVEHMASNALHVSFLDFIKEKELLECFSKQGVNTISLEKMPRTTLAQKMDALSSQASLAGYAAVLHGALNLNRILPMMVTPAGTLQAANIFIIGVGVAGLQAISTARRLGARVEAFDTRPEVEEQVKSLGARFVKVNLGNSDQTPQTYAKALTEEQLEKQRQKMKEVCVRSDMVITTAKLFGKPAPVLLKKDIVEAMRLGSVIVDLAVETGGNVEGSILGQEVMTSNGVKILSTGWWERQVSNHASQAYANNLYAFVEHFWDAEKKQLLLDLSNDILKACLIVHNGEVRV